MIKRIGLGVAVVIAILLAYAALKPSAYTISRDITIASRPESIFPYIVSPKLMETWCGWNELDPKAKISYSGPTSGIGARASWENGDQLGTGSATVTDLVFNKIVKTRIEYLKPFTIIQNAEITLTATTTGTVVKWSVSGENPFFARLICLFGNMEKYVGGNFERGLSKLKGLVEPKK